MKIISKNTISDTHQAPQFLENAVSTSTYNIESAFNKLTGDTDNCINGKIRGTTKKEVRELCGNNWDEEAWKRMVRKSNYAKDKVTNNFPFFDKEKRQWFWY